jgi:hypothetical protein
MSGADGHVFKYFAVGKCSEGKATGRGGRRMTRAEVDADSSFLFFNPKKVF